MTTLLLSFKFKFCWDKSLSLKSKIKGWSVMKTELDLMMTTWSNLTPNFGFNLRALFYNESWYSCGNYFSMVKYCTNSWQLLKSQRMIKNMVNTASCNHVFLIMLIIIITIITVLTFTQKWYWIRLPWHLTGMDFSFSDPSSHWPLTCSEISNRGKWFIAVITWSAHKIIITIFLHIKSYITCTNI